MKMFDVIIVGGGPSGIISGVTGIKQNPGKSYLILKEETKGLVPCGIPYIFGLLGDASKNAMGPKPFIAAGGIVEVDPATAIDTQNKVVTTASGAQYGYEKLVFATGSTPTVPTFLPGHDLEGVEYIKKSYSYIEKLKAKTDLTKNIVVIGGGFIGVEVAEQLAADSSKSITLIEMEKYCLYRAFSDDVAQRADAMIRATNIELYTDSRVAEILGKDGKVCGVKLHDGSIVDAEMVISAIGYRPNTNLAAKAGLRINEHGAIAIDRYMRTNLTDIYAVGDCASTEGFITGRTDNIMLASTATAEARILGYNLFNIRLLRDFAGTLSVFSTEIHDHTFASAGAIEQVAHAGNIEYIVGSFEDVDRHPGTLPGTSKLYVKLIVSPKNGAIIGGEICGGKTAGELINVIALAIQKNVTVYELVSFQVGTHPLLTTAPTKYVLIKAAENAIMKMN